MGEEKVNWFAIKGDIRTNESMTAEEFSNLLDSLGLIWTGSISKSTFNDEDYK
jgi:hypothetical protein